MAHHEIQIPDDVDVKAGSLWAKMPILAGIVGVVGTLATIGLIASHYQAEHALKSYLFAYMTGLSFALGCFIFVALQHLTRSGWSITVRRIAENGMITLPIFALLWLPIGIWAQDIFPHWAHAEHAAGDALIEHKAPYLNLTFFYARAVFYFLCWTIIPYFFWKKSVAVDKGADPVSTTKFFWKLSAISIFVYGVSQTFAAFDWMMSLTPHWYSTIYGVYYFAGSIVAAYAFIALVGMSLQKGGMLKTAINAEHYHDLGKYAFGHTIFWAYIGFSQFMLIWYSSIPEEVIFFYHRVHPDYGWAIISYGLPIFNFFGPFFFLLSRHTKRRKTTLVVGSVWIIVAHIVDIYWLIMPSVEIGHGHDMHFEHFPNGNLWIDFVALAGIMGIFLAAFAWMQKKNKLIPIHDPRLEESLSHENY